MQFKIDCIMELFCLIGGCWGSQRNHFAIRCFHSKCHALLSSHGNIFHLCFLNTDLFNFGLFKVPLDQIENLIAALIYSLNSGYQIVNNLVHLSNIFLNNSQMTLHYLFKLHEICIIYLRFCRLFYTNFFFLVI